jgi:HK97 family phage major capsid protein
MRTTPLYLLALIMAIAGTPLDIFQINTRNLGTECVSPWRRTLSAPIARLSRFLASIRRLFAGPARWQLAFAAVLIVALIFGPHAHAGQSLAIVGVLPAGLKAARQRVADLTNEIKAAKKERAKIGETAIAEKRAMTDDERAKHKTAGEHIDTLEAQLTDADAIHQAAVEANEADRIEGLSGVAAETLEVGKSEEEKKREQPGFFGSCLHAVRRLAKHDSVSTEADQKLVRMMAGPTGANTDVPSDAGFLVAPNQAGTIIQRAYDTGEILKLVSIQPIGEGFNGITLPAIDETSRADGSRYGGIASSWVGQGVTATAGRPKFRLMELKLKKILAFVYGTDELNQDAVAFEAWVNATCRSNCRSAPKTAVVNGDGSNKPVGLLNSGAAVTVTRNTAARVLYEDVSAHVEAHVGAAAEDLRSGSSIRASSRSSRRCSIGIGTAGVLAPIYKPAGISVGPDGTQGYSPATLYGRPILTTEYGANSAPSATSS